MLLAAMCQDGGVKHAIVSLAPGCCSLPFPSAEQPAMRFAACTLQFCLGSMRERGAADISDTVAFDWRRWLVNLSQGRELVGPGVVRVFACRWECSYPPIIAVCRIDGTYATLDPHRQTYPTSEGRHSRTVQELSLIHI